MDDINIHTFIPESPANPAGLLALDGIAIPHPKTKTIVTRVGLRISLKFPDGETVPKRRAAAELMQSFYDMFRQQLTHWLPTAGGSKKKIVPGEAPPLEQPEALANLDEPYGTRLYGYAKGQASKEPATFYASVTCQWNKETHKNSYFEAYLPLSWCTQYGFDKVRELVQTWASTLGALHGTTGLSLLFDGGKGSVYLSNSYFLLKKFPGLDYEDEAHFSVEATWHQPENSRMFKIRTISWLTILGEPIIAELGGRSKMRAALGSDCPLFDYQGGTIIQAMPVPEMGSAEHGNYPEGYRKVAQLTKPVRFENYSGSLFENLSPPLDDRTETLAWLRRFD